MIFKKSIKEQCYNIVSVDSLIYILQFIGANLIT